MNGLKRLEAAIKTAVSKAKKGRPAERGIVQGNSVLVGTKLYAKQLATDLSVASGDVVWVQITDDETTAVIVGA
ncbi:MAG: hypothetical protein J6O04_01485 [Selenomonadaceae bacterium]|nr:hypothetical protein [Selenomonadaceae bacterium]